MLKKCSMAQPSFREALKGVQGNGRRHAGIREPVGGGAEAGVRLGLGKQQEDDFYTAPDNIQRKRLETEVQATEDETRAAKREV